MWELGPRVELEPLAHEFAACLLEQHLLGFEKFTARLQAVEIHPRLYAMSTVVGRVLHRVLTDDIIDSQLHVRRINNSVCNITLPPRVKSNSYTNIARRASNFNLRPYFYKRAVQ